MSTLQITETFLSIQGESTYAGLSCYFIRLATCPLRCTWCDTTYSFGKGEARSIAELVGSARKSGVALVEVTGGEPLAQPGAHELLRELCDAGFSVLLETSGALPIADVDTRVTIIMDLKCPGSGEVERNLWDNLQHLKPQDEVKFVLADREDFEWAAQTVGKHQELQNRALLFSPVHDVLDPGELGRWIVDEQIPARLQLQMHKYLWPGIEQGI